MLKKSLVVALVLGGLAFLIPGMTHHVGRAFDWARDGVEEAVPVEYQIEQAEELIEELDPEIEARRVVVAEAEVEIERLASEIARTERSLEKEEVALAERSEALKGGGDTVLAVAGRTYPRQVVAREVKYALERHKHRTEMLEGRRRTLDARMRQLDSLREHLARLVSERDRLVLDVEELRAYLRENEALEATRGTAIVEDSRLNEVAEKLTAIDKRLRVQRKLIEDSDPLLGSLRREDVDPAEVAASVDAWLSRSETDGERTLEPADSAR